MRQGGVISPETQQRKGRWRGGRLMDGMDGMDGTGGTGKEPPTSFAAGEKHPGRCA